jgi:hypothetical protein
MIELVICIAAIYGISMFVKEMDGPFAIMNKLRTMLLNNKYIGVFVYKLLECYFCVGAWSGVMVYFLHNRFHNIMVSDMILWAFGGAAISLVGSLVVDKLVGSSNE